VQVAVWVGIAALIVLAVAPHAKDRDSK